VGGDSAGAGVRVGVGLVSWEVWGTLRRGEESIASLGTGGRGEAGTERAGEGLEVGVVDVYAGAREGLVRSVAEFPREASAR
jgi:hypothetical protein